MNQAQLPIVVGTDGSKRAHLAVDMAANVADRRGVGLRLVYAFAPLYGFAGLDPTPPKDVLDKYQETLHEEKLRILKRYPNLAVEAQVIINDPAIALVEESANASELFVGARGLGVMRRMLLGSVSRKVASYSKCPVVVVRGKPGREDGPVVVGMAPDDGAPTAVDYAFRAAEARGVEVRVIQAQQHKASNADYMPEDAIRELVMKGMADVAESTRKEFQKVLDGHPNVTAKFEVVSSHAVDALIDSASDASLIVVGSQAAVVAGPRMLGSVAAGVLQGAPVVAVVPTATDDKDN